ncbi:MAG: hypothetical protein JSW15_10455 [Deltaproteobacteria bacterium]|nr:MAG: hypothetical protein JSW15_10455 [Deltaproteobacteria bacterium]
MNHHWLKGILATIIFGSLFLVFNLSFSLAEMDTKGTQNQILVIGTGTIVDGNVAEARRMAISEALVKGVEEYLTRRLGSQGMINNFPRLLQDVIPRAKEEIENFHILAEERMDKHYKILVRVKVNDKVMEERLREIAIVLMEGPPIRVLFLVSQVVPSEGELSYWWKDPETDSALTPVELALHRVFQERGFHPINRLLKIPEGEYSSEMKDLDLPDEDAIRWGRLFSANAVIRGRCEIIEGREVSVMLKALHVENGIMIYRDVQSEKIEEGPGGTDQVVETIEIAVNNVVSRLSPEIMMAMELPEAETNQLELTLKGLRSFRQFREFKGFLEKDIPGVKSVKQTRVRGNFMSISVEFLGDEERLLDMISKQANLPFEADVTRTEEGEIIVVIR